MFPKINLKRDFTTRKQSPKKVSDILLVFFFLTTLEILNWKRKEKKKSQLQLKF